MKTYCIDWFSFIIPTSAPFTHMLNVSMQQVLELAEQHLKDWWSPIAGKGVWQVQHGRQPYKWRIANTDTKVTLSWGHVNPHIYVEISGQACQNISAGRKLEELAEQECMRASRIDFAMDIETDVQPADFIVNMDGKRFKSRSNITSENGNTVYIGSRKSERLCRIYRYHAPHPRHKLLRVEVELKGEAAKLAASEVNRRGLIETVKEVNRPFGWSHPLWEQQDGDAPRIAARAARKERANTVRWIYGSVSDALRRSILDGSLDLQQWLQSTGLNQFLRPVEQSPEESRSSVELV